MKKSIVFVTSYQRFNESCHVNASLCIYRSTNAHNDCAVVAKLVCGFKSYLGPSL